MDTADDIDNDNDNAVDIDMAAAMGFSTFGTQARPSKKRRFNPHADAVTSATDAPPPPPPQPDASSASGSNAVPVPSRPLARTPRPASLPAKPPPPAGIGKPDGAHAGAHDHDGHDGHDDENDSGGESVPGADQLSAPVARQGVPWYVGYYDPASIENPWRVLELQRGLQPAGTWP